MPLLSNFLESLPIILIGYNNNNMSIKTRLDGRSPENYGLAIVDSKSGEVLATVEATDGRANLSIDTSDGLHIQKTNGTVIKRHGMSLAA